MRFIDLSIGECFKTTQEIDFKRITGVDFPWQKVNDISAVYIGTCEIAGCEGLLKWYPIYEDNLATGENK